MRKQPDPASLDVKFDMLRSSSRRRILLAIANKNPRDEEEFTSDSFTSDDTDGDELSYLKRLHHVHLPKLADAGYIEWNPDTATIRRGPNFDDIAPLLRLMAEHEDELPDDWP